MNTNITILGTGAYGLALALMFHRNHCHITMWTKFEEEKEQIEQNHENGKVLKDVKIPSDIILTTNLQAAVANAHLIVIAIPVPFVDNVCQEMKPYVNVEQHFCIASKGIEQQTGFLTCDILRKYIKSDKIAVISGPTFAIDIASYCPVGLVLATHNQETRQLLLRTLQNDHLRLRPVDDIIGVELCGAVKNVIAIAAGIIDGLGFPDSTQAMFITESLNDLKNLIISLGGSRETILTYAGFGDLLLTATSTKSRNYRFGCLLGSNASSNVITEYINKTTIEGLYTLNALNVLLKERDVSMPIINIIYEIVYQKRNPKDLIKFIVEKD